MGRKPLEKVSQREYARRLNVSNEAVSRAVGDGRIKKGWSEKERKIIVAHANAEWGALHMQSKIEKYLPAANDGINQPAAEGTGSTLNLHGGSSYGDAKRVGEILRTQMVALDLKERKGELVSKDEVYKQLFAYGQQLRNAFNTIADRHIDSILASKSRAEAHSILTSAIYDLLEGVTSKEFDFKPRA